MSRLVNATKNVASSFISNILSSVLGFVSRTVFIKVLGSEYLGLAGLLGNVLGALSITELGISTAIGFSLYKTLAEKDYKSTSALMSVYRKAYAVIGVFAAAAGVILFISLDFFVPAEKQPDGTSLAYFVFLFDIVIKYFLSYKTTLISSDNQSYKLTPISISMSVMQTVLQIAVLLIFKNYSAYILVQLICTVITAALQNRFVTRQYPEVDFYSKEHLSDLQKGQLKKNIGGLFITKIGDYLINSTDNLIITKMVSLEATGIYSNYLLIREVVNGFISSIFGGITAGMGNVVAIESDDKKKEVFNTLMFCAYFIYSFEAVCFLCLFNSFIGDIWVGKEFLFDQVTVTIIVVNNYLTGLRIPMITMKTASGTYMEDSWVPFAFSAINLVSSVFLAKRIGIAGVFLGTMIGSLLTADWYRPIVIYKKVFHSNVKEYYKRYILYIALGLGIMALSYRLCSLISFGNELLTFIVKALIAVSIPIFINTVIFFKTKEFSQIREMAFRLIETSKISLTGRKKR